MSKWVSTALFSFVLAGVPACGGDEAPALESTSSALMTQVPDFEGLPGYYKRLPPLAPQGEMLSVWLVGQLAPNGTASYGTYTRTISRVCFSPGCDVDTGQYYALPNNPVMGFAFIAFATEDDSHEYYIVDGILRGISGQITLMQLRRVYDEGPGLPFLMTRIW
jgi:hypothetical protein